MTRQDFLKDIAQRSGAETAVVDKVLKALSGSIVEAVNAGSEVVVPGFGKFSRKSKSARVGRNPQTGGTVDVPAKNAVEFKPVKEFRDQIVQPS